MTSTGQILGTPDYMSPEQWENTHTVGPACDLYALGCTLFFLLTGRAPFADEKHASLPKKMLGHCEHAPPPLSAIRAGLLCRLGRRAGKHRWRFGGFGAAEPAKPHQEAHLPRLGEG